MEHHEPRSSRVDEWARRVALLARPDEMIQGLDGPSARRILLFALAQWAVGFGPFLLVLSHAGTLGPASIAVYLWIGPALLAALWLGRRTDVMPGLLPLVVIMWISLLGVVSDFYLAAAPIVAIVLCTMFVSWMGLRVGPSYFFTIVVGVLLTGLIADDPDLVDRVILVGFSAFFGVVVTGRTSDLARLAHQDREVLLERLGHESRHDALTGLGNRSLLVEQATVALARPDVSRVGLGLIDLDDFKAINDRHGHHVGDEVLRQVGARLEQIAGDNGTAIRIGGDEFAILYQDPAGDARQIARVLEVATAWDFVDDGAVISVQASAGAVIYDRETTSLEDLLRGADTAMYASKRARRSASSPLLP